MTAGRGAAAALERAGAGRLQRLLHFVRRQLTNVVVASSRRRGRRDEHEIAAGRQAEGAVLAAIVRHARAAAARRAERALAGHGVVAKLQHPHVDARHRPAAHVAHDAGDDAAARDRHREIRDRLAVLHDDGRAGAVRPRRAVAGSQIGVLERLQLEPARRQTAKGERAAVVGRRRLARRAARDVRERDAHAARRLLRLAGHEDRAGDRRGAGRDRARRRAPAAAPATAAPHAIATTRTT